MTDTKPDPAIDRDVAVAEALTTGSSEFTAADQQHPARAEQMLPLGIRVAAAWSWRLLLVGAAVAVVIWLLVQVRLIVVPLLIAILLAALLEPIVRRAAQIGIPRAVGVLLALVTLIAVVSVLVWLIITQFRSGYDALAARSQQVWGEFMVWVQTNPFGIDASRLEGARFEVLSTLQNNQSRIFSGALGVATSTAQFFTGAILVLFTLIFLLADGKRIWFWVLGFLPRSAHAAADAAAQSGWKSVGQYVRVQILVAFVDSIGIGLGAWILQVPLAVPLAVLVFLGSFIPFLGAIVTGALACFVALIFNGPVNALIMLAVVLLVQQIESNVLQPLIMGSAVSVHPLGVVIVVTLGTLLAGIPGALFAVPFAAAANAMVNTFFRGEWRGKPSPIVTFHAERDKRAAILERTKRLRKRLKREQQSEA